MRRELLWAIEQPRDCITWAEANGLDPARIPAEDSLYIDGGTIHYREFAKALDGTNANIISFAGGRGVTDWMSTPLIADPDDFMLTTVDVSS